MLSYYTLSDGTVIERHDCPACYGSGVSCDNDLWCYRCSGSGVIEMAAEDEEDVQASFRPRPEAARPDSLGGEG